ncbi:HXXEE domain-containing protein [Paenibacillus sp. SC116]|uniref:HXXEE domain-containing protein n=1 Tax=Paenibacillus sp. SC116 TaxID=2968986 RepID=UPI00215A47A8|nr:HXXEE domain-containing protein [Paenibacillus sp. SC116]MCR8842371.1 HXXEE domain-containing protein [Paenibacillus sp. SC116]
MDSSMLVLFLFAFALHNAEEAVWLIRQSSSLKVNLHQSVTQDQFLFGLLWVTGLACLITALYIFLPHHEILKYAYFGYVGTMILNVLFPHLISTMIERSYSPGLFTGILFLIPINSLIIKMGLDTNTITSVQLIVSTLVVTLFLAASIPLSFWLGRKLITY